MTGSGVTGSGATESDSTVPDLGPVPHFEPTINLMKMIRQAKVARYGARFWALMWAAFLCLGRGVIFNVLPLGKVDLPPGLQPLGRFWLQFYSVGWVAAAAILLYLAFSRMWSPILFAFTAVPALIWSLAFYYSTFAVDSQNINGAIVYQAISGLIYWAARTTPDRGWVRVRRRRVVR
jgi:hypothetical protein